MTPDGPVDYLADDLAALAEAVVHRLAELEAPTGTAGTAGTAGTTGSGGTVAAAESLTGGLVGAVLTAVPGASACFRGAVVAYATDLKGSLLGVDEGLLASEGAVHPEVARQMAAGVRRLCGATYGVSTTGVAGPTEQDGRPVGTVHVGVSGPSGERSVSAVFPGSRDEVRRAAVQAALTLLREVVGESAR